MGCSQLSAKGSLPLVGEDMVLPAVIITVEFCLSSVTAPSASPSSSVTSTVKKLLGLEWQKWAIIIGTIAGVLILFYALKSCLPCWSWTKTLFSLVLGLFKCLFKCCWCVARALPNANSPEAIRRQEVFAFALICQSRAIHMKTARQRKYGGACIARHTMLANRTEYFCNCVQIFHMHHHT